MHLVSVCLHYGNIIWLPWQRPLRYRKKRSRSFICTQNAFGEKIAKIGIADPEIICLREMIKKEKDKREEKRKKLTQAKYIAGWQLSQAVKVESFTNL